MKKLTIVALCVLLAGCGDDAIKSVKESSATGFGLYTYGKVLDNHKVCESSEWKSFEENGVKKVSYKCALKRGKTIYNFDEKTAENIRKEAVSFWYESRKKSIPANMQTVKEELESDNEVLTELTKIRESGKFIETVADNPNYAGPVDMGLYATYFDSEEIKFHFARFLNEKDYESKYNVINRTLTVYKEKSAKGLTAEDEADLKAINNAAQEKAYKFLDAKIKQYEYNVNQEKKELAEYEFSLSEKGMKKEAAEYAETKVKNYAYDHLIKGEEIIIWAFNPVTGWYDVESQYTKQYGYGGKVFNRNLDYGRVIRTAFKNVTDVDVYYSR